MNHHGLTALVGAQDGLRKVLRQYIDEVRRSRRETFDAIDVSGGGVLDKEEVSEHLESRGLRLSAEQLDTVFGQMDSDSSGCA